VGLGWREDESNEDRSLARNRLRHEVLPQLRLLHQAAERNVRATAAELADEAELLDQAVASALHEAGAGGSPPAVELARIAGLPAPLRRLMLRRLAEEAAGGPLPLGRPELAAIERLGAAGGSGELSLGQGVRALCEYGIVRFQRAPDREAPAPAELSVPGSCRFGDWQLECALEPAAGAPLAGSLGSAEAPRLDAGLLAATLVVRSWRDGDRMRPLGLDGTKSLQDLFVDRKVPRSLRSVLPVVEAGGEIAWVAGVAVSESFKVTEATTRTARLDARAGGSGEAGD
jgi:tRNA(Ile)-lysidine synthase